MVSGFWLEGSRRIESVVYEAEQAYLNQFDDLAKRKRGVAYMPYEGASGSMVVINLGGHKDNYAQWDEVYSEKGGKYKMILRYVPVAGKEREINDRRLEVTVNGDRVTVDSLETAGSKRIAQCTVTVNLKKGYNDVKIGSRFTWTPDLDCFLLVPME